MSIVTSHKTFSAQKYQAKTPLKMSKPTVVAFPGAFHLASCMDPFISELHNVGFPAEALSLPSCGNASKGMDDDEDAIRSALIRHMDEDKDVLLVLHSFSGIPGSAAVSGLDRKSRQTLGKKGGLLGIAYISSFIPKDLQSNGNTFVKELQWWAELDVRRKNPEDFSARFGREFALTRIAGWWLLFRQGREYQRGILQRRRYRHGRRCPQDAQGLCSQVVGIFPQ
jgi:hypothetical protein